MSKGIYFIAFIIICVLSADIAFAKDFSSSLRSLDSEIKTAMMVLGPIAFMVAAAAFYFSSRVGWSMLTSAGVGAIVFASAGTIFQFLFRVFN